MYEEEIKNFYLLLNSCRITLNLCRFIVLLVVRYLLPSQFCLFFLWNPFMYIWILNFIVKLRFLRFHWCKANQGYNHNCRHIRCRLDYSERKIMCNSLFEAIPMTEQNHFILKCIFTSTKIQLVSRSKIDNPQRVSHPKSIIICCSKPW